MIYSMRATLCIAHLDVAVSVEEDVLGLDVPVDYVVVVKVLYQHRAPKKWRREYRTTNANRREERRLSVLDVRPIS